MNKATHAPWSYHVYSNRKTVDSGKAWDAQCWYLKVGS
jgi:hypothetical protein